MTGGRESASGERGVRSEGRPVTSLPVLPYATQWIDDDDIAAVVEVLRSDWLTQGPAIERFEKNLAKRAGARHAVAVSSATAGLHLAALALGLRPGKAGITSPITFAASANCILYAGGRVFFADVDPESALMTPVALEDAIVRAAAAGCEPGVVVAISYGGAVPDLSAMQSICRARGWRLIEDAAHSIGAVYPHNGSLIPSGSCAHTDAAVFSFHPVKQVCAGEGGAILTNDDALAEHVRRLRSHGIVRPDPGRLQAIGAGGWYYEQVELGYHYRMTEMQAALADSQLRKLDTFLGRRRELAWKYAEALQTAEIRTILDCAPFDPNSAYHLFVVRFKHEELRRQAYDWLVASGIRSQVHYIPVYHHPHYRAHRIGEALPGAERFHAGCLSLPLFPKMSDAGQQRVLDALVAFARKVGAEA